MAFNPDTVTSAANNQRRQALINQNAQAQGAYSMVHIHQQHMLRR